MASPAAQNPEIEQLKALLFRTEAERLGTLETDVSLLRQYVGDADRLEMATADVLIAALERAEVSRPRELANAIAPSVVTAIRREIANSREMMVDALYPITGRLVSAAVGNAFKELLAFIEQRLNTLTSTQLWVGRIKSLATGRPISEFVLADGKRMHIQRLLMIERGSGRLVANWEREGSEDERADLLSAMVAAILEFSVQALAGEGDLQKLDFGGREIVLRASPRYILAAECVGSLRPADDARINSLFFDAVERLDAGEVYDGETLAELAASIENAATPKKADKRGKIILLAVLAVIVGVLAWQIAGWTQRALIEQRAQAELGRLVETGTVPAAFPLQLDFDHGAQSVVVSGIQPDSVDLGQAIDTLEQSATPYEVINQVGRVSSPANAEVLRADIESIKQTLARLEAGLAEIEAAAEPAADRTDQ